MAYYKADMDCPYCTGSDVEYREKMKGMGTAKEYHCKDCGMEWEKYDTAEQDAKDRFDDLPE